MKFATEIFIIIFVSSATLICYGQNEIVKGTVKGKNSGNPLAYVNIVFAERPSGTYSDEDGKFEIEISKEESLFFSAMGYKRIRLTYSELVSKGNVVTLEEEVVELQQVTITAKHLKGKNWVETLGYLKSKRKSRLGTKTPGFKIATLVVNEQKRVGQVEYILLNMISTGKSRIRLHLYSAKKFPHEPAELFNKDMIIDIGRMRGIRRIKVSEYGINFPPEGLVVGVEFLGNIKDDNRVSTENGVEIETKIFLSRGDTQQNTWIGFKGKNFEREVYSKIHNTICNAMVGLSVRFYEGEN